MTQAARHRPRGTLAGNLTLLGWIANLIVAEGARRRGIVIGFWDYARLGIPLTVLTIAWGILGLSMSLQPLPIP